MFETQPKFFFLNFYILRKCLFSLVPGKWILLWFRYGGTVHRAHHRNTNAEVAVKVIQKSIFAKEPNLVKSINQEIGIMFAIEKHVSLSAIERKEIGTFTHYSTSYISLL